MKKDSEHDGNTVGIPQWGKHQLATTRPMMCRLVQLDRLFRSVEHAMSHEFDSRTDTLVGCGRLPTRFSPRNDQQGSETTWNPVRFTLHVRIPYWKYKICGDGRVYGLLFTKIFWQFCAVQPQWLRSFRYFCARKKAIRQKQQYEGFTEKRRRTEEDLRNA